jgi:hypothetical protein
MTEPQQGDFGLVKINGDAGRLIRIGQALNGDGFDDYEHAFLYLGNSLIIEAEPGGARLNELAYKNVKWSTGIIPLTDKQRTRIAIGGFEFEHVPYSAMDYFALASLRLKLLVTPALENYVKTSKHMICSQLVDAAYAKAGVQLFNDHRYPGEVTPGSLDKRLKNPHNYV